MKKFLYTLGFACMLALTACGGADSKIDRLESIKKEIMELDASNAEDQQKIAKLSAEVITIAADLEQLDKDGKLSDDQKERLTKIMLDN